MAATTSSACRRWWTDPRPGRPIGPRTHAPMKGLPDLGARGEGWVVLQVVLLILLVLAGLLAGDAWGDPLAVLTTLTGVALLLAAASLVGRGFLDLGRNLTPVPRPRDDATLVETGVYRLVRHPLYGGIIVGSFGFGSAHGQPAGAAPGLRRGGLLLASSRAARRPGSSITTRAMRRTWQERAASSPGFTDPARRLTPRPRTEEPGGEVGRRVPTLPPGNDAASPVPPPIVRERGRLDRGRAVERCRCV